MSPLSKVLRRVRGNGTKELEQQIDEELKAHIEMLVEEYLAEGMSPEAADAHARRRFGDYKRIRTEGLRVRRGNERRQRRWDLLADFVTDVRISLRGLRRDPTFATVAIGTLALGIGASAAVFSVLEAVFVRPLPFDEPDRLVHIAAFIPGPQVGQGGLNDIPPAILVDLQERNRVFTDIAAARRDPVSEVNLSGGLEAVRVPANWVSASFFDVLGVSAAIGRTLSPEDDLPAALRVTVLSHGLWVRAFGSDPRIVGRVVRLNDELHTVVGVMPSDFAFFGEDGGSPALWMLGAVTPETRNDRLALTLDVIARLRPGVSLERAQAEMDGIALALADEFPESNRRPETGEIVGIRLFPLHGNFVQPVRSSLLVLSGAVAFVLLIAWVNVANLLLARTGSRRRELAVRTAIGAGRWRVGRQLLTETLVLSAFGGLAGLILARWLIAVFVAAVPPPGGGVMGLSSGAIPLLQRAELNGWVIAITLLTCLVTAAVCGLAPAIQAARSDVHAGLKTGRHGNRRHGAGSKLLVAVEVSLSLVLLIGVGLLVSTMQRIAEIPVGFETEGAHVMRAQLTRERYATLERGDRGTSSARWSLRPEHTTLVNDAVDRLAAFPGVEAVGAVNILPIQGAIRGDYGGLIHFDGEDREAMFGVRQGLLAHGYSFFASVTPGYFRAMGVPLLQGRAFTRADDRSAPAVAIVNKQFVDFYDFEDPVGKRLEVRDGTTWRSVEIVGVVGSVLQFGYYQMYLADDLFTFTVVYLPHAQPAETYGRFQINFHMTANIVARHDGDGVALGAAMHEVLRQADPETPVAFTESMESYLAENLVDRRFQMLLIGILATVSLMLALVGVYGVMAFQVGQRLHEIGVRMALGARADGVVGMIVGEGARVAVLGSLTGIAGAMAATRLLSPWLFGVTPTDPLIFASLATLMVGVAALACWIPARRAARVDPIETLKAE